MMLNKAGQVHTVFYIRTAIYEQVGVPFNDGYGMLRVWGLTVLV